MFSEIDIVLPCYNPPAGWKQSIVDFYKQVSGKYKLSFIVVDDGSTAESIDNTFGETFPLRIIKLDKNKGKGFALREGVRASQAPLVLYTDIDLPFKAESMERVISMISSGNCDIVAGHRDDAYYQGTMTGFRKALSKSFRFFMKNVLRISLNDTQCGLKAFNNKGKALFLATTIDRYLFDFEFIYAAVRSPDIKLCTASVELKQNVVFSKMPLNVLLRESANLLQVLAKSAVHTVRGRKQ